MGRKRVAPDIGQRPPWQEKRAVWVYSPPKRDRNPRQPPACALGGPICWANSSGAASSSIPGSSGARTMGITAGMGVGTAFGMSCRARNRGAAATGAGSVAGGGTGAGATAGAGSSTAAASGGALSWAAGAGSTGGAAGSLSGRLRRLDQPRPRRGVASIASSNGEDSIAAPFSDGRPRPASATGTRRAAR